MLAEECVLEVSEEEVLGGVEVEERVKSGGFWCCAGAYSWWGDAEAEAEAEADAEEEVQEEVREVEVAERDIESFLEEL